MLGGPREQSEQHYSYFSSYGDLRVHQTMLSDTPRMEAYHRAIVGAREYFKDAVVLDVGAGTGILSIWVAKETAASRVIAVEASEAMAAVCRKLADANGVADRVEVRQGPVETLELDGPVDIILSEWMGHYLLHEGMLDSVLHARDRLLRRDPDGRILSHNCSLPDLAQFRARQTSGLLLPCVATLWGGLSRLQSRDSVDWASQAALFGVDISPVFGRELLPADGEPLVCHIAERPAWATDDVVIAEFDLYTVTPVMDIERHFEARFTAHGHANCYALSFTCRFPDGTVLDTRSGRPVTHWKQTLLMLGGDFEVGPELVLPYDISVRRKSAGSREYDLEFSVA